MDSEIKDVYEILGRNLPKRVYTWEQMESGVIDLPDDIDKEKEEERALWVMKQEGKANGTI